MDFRDLFRGLFGLKPKNPEDRSSHSFQRNIQRDFDDDSGLNGHGLPSNPIMRDREDFPAFSELPGGLSRNPDFIFSDLFGVMEDMFHEMEQSMKDVDQFFGNFGTNEARQFRSILDIPQDSNSKNDIAMLPPPVGEKAEKNIRDLVLKPMKELPVQEQSEKVDKDLDELFQNYKLNLSEMPLPGKGDSNVQGAFDIEKSKTGPYRSHSSYERVYSTYSFKDGKWEGKTVRENNEGKEITTVYQNENGEKEEIKEYFQKNGDQQLGNSTLDSRRTGNFLDFFFKPRL